MCGLPSRDLGTQGILFGPTGKVRDAIFGKGTSQKISDRLDKLHMNTVGKVVKPDFIKSIGFLPEGNKTLLVDQIDLKEQKRQKAFNTAEAERDRVFRSLGQTNAPQSILGG